MGAGLSRDARPQRGCIRSLVKGLDLLETLNAHPGMRFGELCRATGLSEGTAFRMLRTLGEMGLVTLDADTRRYSVAPRAMMLSHGYDAEAWVSAIAWPRLKQLGGEIGWPVSLLMLSGAQVLVRANTDQYSQMVFGVSRAGTRLPILGSCSGLLLLAHLSAAEQAARLALLETTPQRAILASRSTDDWQALFGSIRQAGWWTRSQSETRQSFVSFPLMGAEGMVLAAITVKYFTSAMKPEDAVARHGAAVQAAAADIARGHAGWQHDLQLDG